MKLSEVLKNIVILESVGKTDIEICGIQIDSRKIEAGHLFIAVCGKPMVINISEKPLLREQRPLYVNNCPMIYLRE